MKKKNVLQAGAVKVQVIPKPQAPPPAEEYEVVQPVKHEETQPAGHEAPPAENAAPPPKYDLPPYEVPPIGPEFLPADPPEQTAPSAPRSQENPVDRAELIEDVRNLTDYDVAKAVDYISSISKAFESTEGGKASAAFSAHPPPLHGEKDNPAADGELLIASGNASFQYQEAFHSLRTNIKYLLSSRENRKIIITSSIPSEGKSIISINLALALSAANNSVGLIDADFRKPMLHSYLGIPAGERTGLANVLRGTGDIKSCLYRYAGRDNLYVVPCGEIPPNPAEILGSSRMEHFIDVMAKHFDYVIIDTPPVSVVTDAAVLSQFADGVLMVVRQKMVTFDQARRAKRHLENVNANILGAVLNDFDAKHLYKESGYYYNYYYNDYYISK